MKKAVLVFLLAVCAPDVWCQVINSIKGCDKPSGNFSFRIEDKNVIFSNAVVGATSWKWDFGDGDTSTSKEPTHNYRTYGNFNVCLTAFADCSQSLFCTTIPVIQVISAVEQFTDSSVQLFPNPVNDQLGISFNGTMPQSITVINSSGCTMQLFTKEEVRSSLQLNFSQYAAGTYFLTWTTAGTIQSRRIVKRN